MRKLYILCSLLLLPLAVLAQNLERYNWYFGNSTRGLQFNRVTKIPAIVPKAVPFGTGGSSTASHPQNGNILFYTDGNNVYDALNQVMPNGNLLMANPASNQPTVICPVPGQPNKYFIFTNDAAFPAGGTIRVSVVDMASFGNAPFPTPPLGDVESKNGTPFVLNNRAEGMIIVPNANGTDFFLITQEMNTGNFQVTEIDAGSYGGAYTTNNFLGLTGVPLSAANIAYHAGTGRMAVSAQDSDTDAIMLQFNNTTGALTFDDFIPSSGLTTLSNQSIYDIEYSPSGRYLYLSRHGDGTVTPDVLQYDYTSPITTLASVLPNPVFRSHGLQMGPDSMIYHLYQSVAGTFLLGRIADSDSVASKVIYTESLLTNSSFNGTQFPAFAPPAPVTLLVDFTFAGTCQNSPTTFFPDIAPGADSVRWDFGDGESSNAWSPVYTYAAAGTYPVVLNAFYQNQLQTATHPVTIQTFTLQLDLVQDTVACRSEFPPPRGTRSKSILPPDPNAPFNVTVDVTGGTATSYNWSNGDTGPILTPDSAGYYYVVVSDGSGCSAYAGVNVREYGLQDQRANIWYFGNHAGIDFNEQPPIPLDDSAMDAPEGCAIICDRNGKVIFYTDGNDVFDRTHALIASGIGGETNATQSSIVFPVPGDETLYYIFTTESVNSGSANMVRYSLFDLKQNGGLGAVVQQNLPLFARSTERITAVGRWLIIHESGNNSFRAYPISALGIGQPVITSIGSVHPTAPLENGEGYMKAGPNFMVAVALSTPGASNLLELFTLVDSSGVLTNYRRVDISETDGQLYGVEFSPAGNKLFATMNERPSGESLLYEVYIDSLGIPYKYDSMAVTAELGAIQIAPDGNLYVAVDGTGSDFLGTIQVQEDTLFRSGFTLQGFALAASTNSRLGLPNFVQQISNAGGGPSIDVIGVCIGSATTFVGTPRDNIDEFSWEFGNGATAGDSSTVTHTYSAAGDYLVSMTLHNRCDVDTTLTRSVTIFNPPDDPTIPGAETLCNGPVTLDAGPGNGLADPLRYVWTRGDTTQVVIVTEQSILGVTITDANGCTSTAQTLVADSRPQLDLPEDLNPCQFDTSLGSLDAENQGATYLWSVSGANGTYTSSNQTVLVRTNTPGVDTYSVQVTITLDPVGPITCSITEDVVVTVKPSPSITLSGIDPTTCASPGNGTVNLTVNSPPPGPFSVSVNGPAGFTSVLLFDQTPQSYSFNPVDAGSYFVSVTDQLLQCETNDIHGLTGTTATANAIASDNCDPVTLTINTTATVGPAQSLTYRVLNDAAAIQDSGTGALGSTTITTNPITVGNYNGLYTIEVTEPGGCVFYINDFSITPDPTIPVTFTNNMCTSPATLVATTAATTFNWTVLSGTGSIDGGNGTNTVDVSGTGAVTFRLQASGGLGTCPADENNVVFFDNPIADFTQGDPCADPVYLTGTTAATVSTYTFVWYEGGVSTGLTGQQISRDPSHNNLFYQVTAYSFGSGCISPLSPSKQIKVIGEVDAGFEPLTVCEDGQPFTIESTTSATGTTYVWLLGNTVIPGETGSSTTQTQEGTYTVRITKDVCTTPASILIDRKPLPVGNLPNVAVICNDPDNTDPTTMAVDLNPGVFQSYDWFLNELSLGYTAQVRTAESEGLYRVMLTNSFRCTAPDETEVLNDCQPIVEAPNAFRPSSGVELNRSFFVISNFITDEFSVFIFNRWGELIFTSNDKDFTWNGGVNNSLSVPAPGGSYSYVIRYVSSFRPEKGVQEKRGGVALLR